MKIHKLSYLLCKRAWWCNRAMSWISCKRAWVYIYTYFRNVFEGALAKEPRIFKSQSYRVATKSLSPLSRSSLSAKEPLLTGLICGKWPARLGPRSRFATPWPHLITRCQKEKNHAWWKWHDNPLTPLPDASLSLCSQHTTYVHPLARIWIYHIRDPDHSETLAHAATHTHIHIHAHIDPGHSYTSTHT